MAARNWWMAALLALSWGCGNELKPRDYGDPTSLASPTEQGGIVAWIEAPRVDATLATATPELVIAAHTKEEPYQELRVLVGRLEKDERGLDRAVDMRPALAEGEPGPEQRFRLQSQLTHGTNRLIARIETADQLRVRRLTYALEYQGDDPGVVLSVRAPAEPDAEEPCLTTRELNAYVTGKTRVCVSGRATASGGGKLAVALGIAGFEPDEAAVDDDGTFSLSLELAENRSNVITATVRDDDGRSTTAQVAVVHDGEPPQLAVTTHARETSASSLELEGQASDPNGIDAVEVLTQDGAVLDAGVVSPWKVLLQLAVGENPVTVLARDLAGNETREQLTLSRLRTLWLGGPKEDVGATQIDLTRPDLEELLTPEDQAELSVVQVELLPAIRQSLERIREPERFGVDTSGWGNAERNLQRILNMTPDTADLTGTSVEELLDIANAVGLPSPRLLAQLLDMGVTDFIVDPEVAAQVLTEKLIGTHPNIARDESGRYVIDVSLYDVFQNLSTLAPRFGPSGAHPGFLEGESYSAVLEPGFLLSMPVRSNLVQYDALDLSRASKDYYFILNGDRVLDFNTLTDEFTVVGLTDEPTVDLRIKILEHPGAQMLRGGTSRTANPDPSFAGFYRGDGEGYGVEPWYFEHATVEIGYRMFFRSFEDTNFQRVLRYDAGSIEDAAVMSWDRGWLSIDTAGGIGAPPPDIYIWDLLMEVAQVRLHDNGVPEGQAEMAFSLEDLSVGLTADELVEKLRPRLAEQEAEISELLVGDVGLAESRADLFYMPAGGEDGALLFRSPEDGEGEYNYQNPGFFSDDLLKNKVSTSAAAGGVEDAAHEKVPATLGAVYYAQDDESRIYRIEVAERDGERIGVRVSEVGAVQ